ncbi:DUF192 domain-containing protein [Granulicella sp. WH15]|uniref:DUF192 domain-containing protein n=1 Tax=Granulicella sp. WH15 TaxID=2602070 RepID=UPI002106580D|nr:DUF192 domain-containing protein [Granulicella sp. WH15]
MGGRIEVANTTFRRAYGLLGRRRLEAEEGLWIRPSSGIHTFGMAFPIDVIGLDKELKVIRLWSAIPPYRMTSLSWSMRSVLELPPGKILEAGTQIGDLLCIGGSV